MTAIWKRELRSFYYSPIAYVFMGVVLDVYKRQIWPRCAAGSARGM